MNLNRQKLKQAEAEVVRLQAEIVKQERDCQHEWSAPEYSPVARVASNAVQHTKRWKRECLLCSRVDFTFESKPGPELPVFARNCPCWVTGRYVWVEGCPGHPRESMT